MENFTEGKGPGRPKGARDRKNIFLGKDSTTIILHALVHARQNELEVAKTEAFERTFTLFSSFAIEQLGSSVYLKVIGK